MSGHEEFDYERMRRDEDIYLACRKSPPKAFKEVAVAVMEEVMNQPDSAGEVPNQAPTRAAIASRFGRIPETTR